LSHYLFPEVHKWAQRADWSRVGRQPELLTLSVRRGASCEAFALASNRPELMEGAHAEHLLYVFDEAKAIPDGMWDSAEGSLTGPNSYALAISTPGIMLGRFFDIHSHKPGYEDWWTRHVTLAEAMVAGRVTQEWVDKRKAAWGERSPLFAMHVLGEFAKQAEESLLNLEWIDAARLRDLPSEESPVAGVDIARTGADDSVHCQRRGGKIGPVTIWHGHDTMESAGRIKQAGVPCGVDVIGVGAGVYDRLAEQGFDCWPVNVAESATESERFTNLRAELAWRVREMFERGEIDLSELSDDVYVRLAGELMALKLDKPTSSGQMRLVPKDETKKVLGHSPDVADALMMSFAPREREIGDFVEV